MSPLHAEETAIWLAENAKVSSAGILIPDDVGAFNLEMTDATGVTIGEKPPGGGDAKSLVFSGDQTSVFRSVIPFPSVVGTLKVELDAMIPIEADVEDATILRYSSQWEVRFIASRPAIALIVWHDSNIFTQVNVPIEYDKWSTITAEYTGEELIVTADGVTERLAAKDVIYQSAGEAHLILGASSTKLMDNIVPRLLKGSLANIRVTAE